MCDALEGPALLSVTGISRFCAADPAVAVNGTAGPPSFKSTLRNTDDSRMALSSPVFNRACVHVSTEALCATTLEAAASPPTVSVTINVADAPEARLPTVHVAPAKEVPALGITESNVTP